MARRRADGSTVELNANDVASLARVYLLVHHAAGADVVALQDARPVVIGRKPPADVVVNDPTLSGRHARFLLDGETLWLEDLESTNGCTVDQKRVTREPVSAGKEVRLGQVLVTVHTLGSRAISIAEHIASLAPDSLVRSAAMESVYAMAQKVARSSLPILIQGETGVGKEVLARAIHASASDGRQPLRSLNCGAVPAQLLESALFGHEEGAFTGATESRPGIFEEAGEGTVLLDEIGELSPTAQVALLRVLEERRVRRLGSQQEVEIKARVIAATHRDLEQMVTDGTFREDLLFRLNALTLTIPPLRKRQEEIVPLAEQFIAKSGAAKDLSPEFVEWMMGYAWPGNVRELRNIIERGILLAEGSTLTLQVLPDKSRHAAQVGGPLKSQVQSYEKKLIVAALKDHGWNQSAAARQLDMPVRTLTSKMKNYGIERPKG